MKVMVILIKLGIYGLVCLTYLLTQIGEHLDSFISNLFVTKDVLFKFKLWINDKQSQDLKFYYKFRRNSGLKTSHFCSNVSFK